LLPTHVSWQLKNPIIIKPSATLAERIRSLGDKFADFADELDEPADKVSDIFPSPREGHFHIIVKLPVTGGWSMLPLHMTSADNAVSNPFHFPLQSASRMAIIVIRRTSPTS
jgi:hypothetical protein